MEQEKSSASIKTKVIQETKSVSRSAASIPNGKYLTVTQVSEICGVKEKTVSAWLKKGLLKSLDLPGLGQIVEEKDLEKYLAENKTDPDFAKYKHILNTRVSIHSFTTYIFIPANNRVNLLTGIVSYQLLNQKGIFSDSQLQENLPSTAYIKYTGINSVGVT